MLSVLLKIQLLMAKRGYKHMQAYKPNKLSPIDIDSIGISYEWETVNGKVAHGQQAAHISGG